MFRDTFLVALLLALAVSACSRQENVLEAGAFKNENKALSDHKVKFQKHIEYLERKALDNPQFAEAKRDFSIQKWGELLASKLERPVLSFPTGVCFDLRKVEEPWFVVHQPYLNLNHKTPFANDRGLPSGVTQRFILAGDMAALGLPFDDKVESDIIFNVGQNYLAVVVDGRVNTQGGVKKLAVRGLRANFKSYKDIIGHGLAWEPSGQPAYSNDDWVFQRYVSSEALVAIDFNKRGFYRDNNWSVIDNKTINHVGGYPDEPLIQGISLVGVGKYIDEDERFWVEFNLPSESTPRVAEVFDLIDAEIQSLIITCESKG